MEFTVQNLKPMCIVDSIEFLHLMDVVEPSYVVLCCRTVNKKKYFTMKSTVQQELQEVDYLGLAMDM